MLPDVAALLPLSLTALSAAAVASPPASEPAVALAVLTGGKEASVCSEGTAPAVAEPDAVASPLVATSTEAEEPAEEEERLALALARDCRHTLSHCAASCRHGASCQCRHGASCTHGSAATHGALTVKAISQTVL